MSRDHTDDVGWVYFWISDAGDWLLQFRGKEEVEGREEEEDEEEEQE